MPRRNPKPSKNRKWRKPWSVLRAEWKEKRERQASVRRINRWMAEVDIAVKAAKRISRAEPASQERVEVSPESPGASHITRDRDEGVYASESVNGQSRDSFPPITAQAQRQVHPAAVL